jgi:hypothetical protein
MDEMPLRVPKEVGIKSSIHDCFDVIDGSFFAFIAEAIYCTLRSILSRAKGIALNVCSQDFMRQTGDYATQRSC